MTSAPCARWRGIAAAASLSPRPDSENRALHAHLAQCAACRTEAEEFAVTAAALIDVVPGALADDSVPPELTATVLGSLARARRRRVAVLAATLGAAALVASLAWVNVSGVGTPSSATRRLALSGLTSNASVHLSAEPWGTSVVLTESGLAPGVYTVSMESKSGRWWTTGSYRARAGTRVAVSMSCAVALGRIAGVRVVDGRGVVVLSGGASPTTAAY